MNNTAKQQEHLINNTSNGNFNTQTRLQTAGFLEPRYSTYFKEKEMKHDKETNLFGKNSEEIKSYRYNYFLTKKPKTSKSQYNNLSNFRLINTVKKNSEVNEMLINQNRNIEKTLENINTNLHNPLFSNKIKMETLVDINNTHNRKLNEDFNKMMKEERVSPWNINSKKNQQYIIIDNPNSMKENSNSIGEKPLDSNEKISEIGINDNTGLNDVINNRNEIEQQATTRNNKKKPAVTFYNAADCNNSIKPYSTNLLPNINNYTRPNEITKGNTQRNLKLSININPEMAGKPELMSNSHAVVKADGKQTSEFKPMNTSSSFFKNSVKNQYNKSLNGVISPKSNNHIKREFVLLNEYFDGINKSILARKPPETSQNKNRPKMNYYETKKLKIQDAFKPGIDNKLSLTIIDNFLKRKEIFG